MCVYGSCWRDVDSGFGHGLVVQEEAMVPGCRLKECADVMCIRAGFSNDGTKSSVMPSIYI